MKTAQPSSVADETVEGMIERLWCTLPSVFKVRASLESVAAAEEDGGRETTLPEQTPVEGGSEEPAVGIGTSAPLRKVLVPADEMRQLAGCLYMACHTNPVEADVEDAITAILDNPRGGARTEYSWGDFREFLERVESRWMEWADAERKWAAVAEHHHVQVLKELLDSVTYDVEPFGLLPRDKVLTLRSSIVRTKELKTLFKTFVKFVTPPEYAAVYDKLWGVLVASQLGSRDVNPDLDIPLELEQFAKFVSWFCLSVLANATELGLAVVAKTLWLRHLNGRGVMLKKQFVEACRYMCKFYGVEDGDVQYLERCYRWSEQALEGLGEVPSYALFQHPMKPAEGRLLVDPNELYVPEELEQSKWMEELHRKHCSPNRIVVHGRRGVGKTVVAASLARRLGCVHLDVAELALMAEADAPADTIGAQLRECRDSGTRIPLEVLSALVRRKVCSTETHYRGYVFSDIPFVSGENDARRMSFLTECGILDELVPTAFVLVDCEAEFHQERLEATLAARELDHQEELRLVKEEDDEEASEQTLTRKIEELQAQLSQKTAQLAEGAVEQPLGGETAKPEEESVEIEKELKRLIDERGAQEAKKVEQAGFRAARAKRYKELKLRRLVDQCLSEGYESGSGVPLMELPCFEAVLDHAHALGRCLSVDCGSQVEEAVTYVVDTLLLQPCVLPWALAEKLEGSDERGSKIFDDPDVERLTDEFASDSGVTTSARWKRFCPVTFAEQGILVEGSVAFGCVYRKQLFYLASEEKLRMFKANPCLYLGTTPLNGEPILLLSVIEPHNAAQLPRRDAEELVQRLHEQLHLTPMTFNEFGALWDNHRQLKGERAGVLSTRAKYEVVERKQRAERLKKRLAQEARKKKLNKSTGRGKGKKSKAPEEEVVVEEYKGWEKVDKPETISTRIAKDLEEKLERQNTFVPILVHALDDSPLNGFDQLFSEKVIPRMLVVLQCENSENPADNNDLLEPHAAGMTSGGDGAVGKIALPQQVVLDKLGGLPDGGGAGGASAHDFSIHRIVVNDKGVDALVTEIIQAVCPGVDLVEPGSVNETLGEDDNSSPLEYEEDENEEDEVLDVVNPAVRPGKTFLSQFGTTLEFCPVTLCEKMLLVRGQSDQCLQYRGKLYTFASSEAKTKFECNPLRYMRPSYPLPPCRLWIVGHSKSGKKTLARSLQETYGLPFFQYNRKLFDNCVQTALSPSGGVVGNIFIPPQTLDNPYIAYAESILKEVRAFDPEQERRLKLREEAERELERREEAAANGDEEEDELDEEVEARLREYLEFEPETEHERELRLSEAYLKVAGCVTHMEPFASKGYIMVCPPFSDGDIEVMSSVDAVPEIAVRVELSDDVYVKRNKEAMSSVIHSDMSSSALREIREEPTVSDELKLLRKLESETLRKEREVARWRRRHIGADDPESDLDEDIRDEGAAGDDRDHGDEVNDRSLEEDLIVEKEAVGEFAEAVDERLIPLVVLNGDLSKSAVFRTAVRRLGRVLENRRSLLFSAQVVRHEEATRMLASGEATLSQFGSVDPVTLYDTRHGSRRVCKWRTDGKLPEEEPLAESNVLNSDAREAAPSRGVLGNDESEGEVSIGGQEPQEHHDDTRSTDDDAVDGDDEELSEVNSELAGEVAERYANQRRRGWLRTCQRVALLRGRLFFFDSDATLLRYVQNPLLFVHQPPPPPPLQCKPVISLYDGKSSCSSEDGRHLKKRCPAEHVAFNLGYIYLSLPKLLAWGALNSSLLSLSTAAISAVLCGAVSDALVSRLLAHRLGAADAKRKGVVLHNLPRSSHQYSLLLEWGLHVNKMIHFEDEYSNVASFMKSTATIGKLVMAAPASVAALAEVCECVDNFVLNEGRAILCRLVGLPTDINNSYHMVANIEAHLSPYRWFCPYRWCLGEDLVDQRMAETRYAALYIGRYYFFSSEEYLKRFLAAPAEVTLPPGFRPLPDVLPSRVEPNEEYPLELEGCCPVLLYDTRENRGLRGVPEPVAEKGSASCVVEYKGRYYAMLNQRALERFLMRPWQYVEGAKLPPSRKVPLPEGKTMSTIDEEEFIRRALYDPIAHALIAVAEARPKYYGLSLEESALKYIALHMKCFNPRNSEIQAEQYKKRFETYNKQSTLYKTITRHTTSIIENEEFAELCDEWENSKYARERDLSIHCGCDTDPV